MVKGENYPNKKQCAHFGRHTVLYFSELYLLPHNVIFYAVTDDHQLTIAEEFGVCRRLQNGGSIRQVCRRFGTIFARRNFFAEKFTHAGNTINTGLPACCIYHFTVQFLYSSAQNRQNAENTAIV